MIFFVNELLFIYTYSIWACSVTESEKVCFKMNWSLMVVRKVLLTTVNRTKEQSASVLLWSPQIF